MKVVNSEVQRRVVVRVLERDVGLPVQQQRHRLHMTAVARVVQSRVLTCVNPPTTITAGEYSDR